MSPEVLDVLPAKTEFIPESQLDNRSDEDIIKSITQYYPVTSNKNVWAFWQTGWETMRPWCKRNVIGWIRRLDKDWTVRVLDCVPDSPNNVYKFLGKDSFPPAFNENRMTGPYVGAHSADLVRLPCLYEYGGVWMDVSIMLFRSLEEICWSKLTDDSTTYEIGGFVLPNNHKDHQIECGYMENWFIASPQKHNPFIQRWHAVFLHYWQDTQESKDAKKHLLFEHLDTDGYRQDMIDYLAQHLSFQRVRTLVDVANGWNGPEYYRRSMYFLDARTEAYYLPDITRWKGKKCFDILSHRRRPSATPSLSSSASSDSGEEADSDAYVEASKVVLHMAGNSCLMKSAHGFKGDTQLSDLWNKPENHGADIEPGTLAEYLSAASLYVRQLRTPSPIPVDETSSIAEPKLHAELLQPRQHVQTV